ncbi:ATP-binding protein [Massilia sp. PAMC28688]|uniref:AAA family ATPase n=1 Tax=Massilia sp. PAMC28688 TaxID=2861283 RepID=UPI001C63326F|nr:ATP-binding protein [Massilia sp. PAMC28688]QYF92444.1 ATP-binding protein [Massilia sp. PAMC28688]
MSAVARVAILGAESSGKSTLAEALARRYDTLWVPEYLREFVDREGRVPFEQDQYGIARVQMEREDAAAAHANRFLFCDTTPLMTALYSRWYWGRVDDELAQLALRHDYAYTLVTAPDTPWQADGLQRESEQVRQQVHEQVIERLAERGIAYQLVGGSLPERILQAGRYIRAD